MKAFTVNKVHNFERGINPKKALGIGGISLFEQKNRIKEENKKKLLKDWNNFLKKTCWISIKSNVKKE